MPEKRLEGQRAIVTGASGGIGAAIAERYAAEGASIWAAGGGNEAGLKRAIEACRAAGASAEGRPCDLSDGTRAGDIVREGVEYLGGLDILVNCAGARAPGPVTEFTDEEIIRVFHVNAISAFIASREAARLMVPQGSGRILNIGSIFGEIGVADNVLYCATKVTLHSLTRALAVELGPRGIRVNCILPGTTLNERTRKRYAEDTDYAASRLQGIPARRFAEPEEMAALAAFMVSGENDFMNGACVTSDGGTTVTLAGAR
ncbi:MAG: SDR family oxidoreductase [Nitrospinota bacterium]|jgi:NAD(P)-dependent dehydrogenase (short-subunit alcohol dehydrogenase family)|nr:SDR family oxidoreductase [Nitrospinota bacterium]MDP7167579.1 SDR family oxidoreductase [Nitrospinota bacterium]MDP7371624.1 SDR family oxidoreductase [Nitrospinota bacterium]MDP7504960.1 SDR family oxidoreductase [Nitrospinota bacterium]MDP7662122.1 SDR family oxidoreductase [Nitrospinota bacterium]